MTAQRKATTVFYLTLFLASVSLFGFSQDKKWKEWEAKADTLYKQEDFKGAVKMYNKAIDLSKLKDKDAYRSVYKRAVSYYTLGQFDEALKDLNLFIPQFPQVSQAKLLRAFIYRELGDDDKQLENLEAAIGSQPPNPDLLKWRGMLYLQKEEYAKAKSDLTLARLLQDDPETETYLGLAYYNLQHKDSAYVSFNKSIELDAMYTPAYLYAGSVSLEDSNYKLALEYLNLALRLDPKNKEATFYKGVALIELERTDEGCKCLNRAFYAGMDEAGGYLREYCYPTDN